MLLLRAKNSSLVVDFLLFLCPYLPELEFLKEPKNRFQVANSARLCGLAGRLDYPIPTRFLAPIDCLKIPALPDPAAHTLQSKTTENLVHVNPLNLEKGANNNVKRTILNDAGSKVH
jgi:hypothetical protein